MTDELSFIIAAVALLATPGPTNTLLATSGAALGFRKSLVLLLGEFLGYMIAIAFLIAAMGPIVARAPNFGLALRIASGLYLLHVAWKLWGHTEEMLLRKGGVSLRQVFVATLLNPKALIFAFAIIPFGSTGDIWKSAPWLATLSAAYCDRRLMLDSGRHSIAEGHGRWCECAHVLPRRGDRSDPLRGTDLRNCDCRPLANVGPFRFRSA